MTQIKDYGTKCELIISKQYEIFLSHDPGTEIAALSLDLVIIFGRV